MLTMARDLLAQLATWHWWEEAVLVVQAGGLARLGLDRAYRPLASRTGSSTANARPQLRCLVGDEVQAP